MTAKVRNVRREICRRMAQELVASISVHEGHDKFIIHVTRTDIIVVLTRITKIF